MNDIQLIIDGKEYICRPMEETRAVESERPRTGYERVDNCMLYYHTNDADVNVHCENSGPDNEEHYEIGNYYNDEQFAIDNGLAEMLMRRMRQWQALNDKAVDWHNLEPKFFIYFNHHKAELNVEFHDEYRDFGQIYFSSEEKAQEALDMFYDELMWYFTEYRQRLDEPKGDK